MNLLHAVLCPAFLAATLAAQNEQPQRAELPPAPAVSTRSGATGGKIPVQHARVTAPLLSEPGLLDERPLQAPLRRPPTPTHPRRTVPAGNGRPLPPGPPTPYVPRNAVGPAGATVRVWMNTDAGAGAKQKSITGEPSAIVVRDTAFMTANVWAALSKDSGKSWEYLDPRTKFPAPDGPMCCDQYLVYSPRWKIAVWILQYNYSKTTKSGGYRVAVSDRENMRKGVWWSYYFRPQNMGFGDKTWFDYPHVACTNDYVDIACWVFAGETGGKNGRVWFRLPLSAMAKRQGFGYGYLPGINQYDTLRLTSGATTTMYAGHHLSTSRFRVYRWTERASSVYYDDRDIALWYSGPKVSPGPDGRKWMQRATSRPLGAWVAQGRIGFIWCSAAGGTFPRPFLRTVEFQESNRAVVRQQSVWNPGYAFAFPCISVNQRGHLAGSYAVGGGSLYPTTQVFIVDDLNPTFQPLDNTGTGLPTHGPIVNAWGDYYTSAPHSQNPNTWVATSMLLNGGPYPANQQVRYVWLGRDRDMPKWVYLAAQSTPVTGVPMTIAETDLRGNKDGPTNLSRIFSPGQSFTITAPAVHVTGSRRFRFNRWAHRAAPSWSFVYLPVGQQTLTVDDMGSSDDTAVAQYVEEHALAVRSINPVSGVPITVSVRDVNGRGDGVTPFDRAYLDGASVVLSAPAAVGSNPFDRWRINGTDQAAGVRTVGVRMTRATTAEARYRLYSRGTFRSFGISCSGSNGRVSHTASGVPDIGSRVGYNLAGAPASTACVLFFGLNDKVWNTIPLPFPVPGAPGCSLYTDLVIMLTAAVDRTGLLQIPIVLPNDPKLVGARLFTQYMVVDPRANSLGLTFTAAIETIVGGLH